MKNTYKIILIFAFTIFVNNTFGQSNYEFKSGGKILQNQKEISPDNVRKLLIKNQPALELYESGRTKKSFGNVLIIGGVAILTGKLLLDLTTDTERNVTYGNNGTINIDQKRSTLTGYIIGGVMLVSAIPIKIGFSKKIKKAVELMNEGAKNPETSLIQSTSFVINDNGIGVRATF